MRKSIFDIVSQKVDMASETSRIVSMATEEKVLAIDSHKYYTLFDFIDEYVFKYWQNRGHFLDVDDFIEALDFENLQHLATEYNNVDALITIIELIYNFWVLSNKKFFEEGRRYSLQWCGNYYHLKDVIDDLLGQYNHTAYIDKKNDRVLVIEDKGEITAVAEIMETDSLALDVIKYNHRTLKGEVELKKKILLDLAAELEPKRKELRSINSTLEDNIFFMLNNLNIRHNNRSKKDKNYREYVAKMRKDRLEKWYDELYQMILLAFLLLGNVERADTVKELKAKIIGGQA